MNDTRPSSDTGSMLDLFPGCLKALHAEQYPLHIHKQTYYPFIHRVIYVSIGDLASIVACCPTIIEI